MNGIIKDVSADNRNYLWNPSRGLVVGTDLENGTADALIGMDELRITVGQGIDSNYTPSLPFPNP